MLLAATVIFVYYTVWALILVRRIYWSLATGVLMSILLVYVLK
jgi:hypothetical protein